MRPALPGELYEIFALPGVLYENLALITGHCMEYTLACMWCYYYDDGLETYIQHIYLKDGGSSLITTQIGHRDTEDDLKI